jgi:phospholipase/lecithinase/hemolysin
LTGDSVSPLPASAVPTVVQQVAFYTQQGLPADPNVLFVLWGGANDLRDAISYASAHPGESFAKGDAVVKNAVDNIKQSLVGLESQGPVNVLVPNLPDPGQIPETRTLAAAGGVIPTAQYATALTGLFNADLDSMLFQGTSATGGAVCSTPAPICSGMTCTPSRASGSSWVTPHLRPPCPSRRTTPCSASAC